MKWVAALLAMHFGVLVVLGVVFAVTNFLFTPLGGILAVSAVVVAFVVHTRRQGPPP